MNVRIMKYISALELRNCKRYVRKQNSRCQPSLRISRFPLVNLGLLSRFELDLELISQRIHPPLDVLSPVMHIEQESLESQKVYGIPRVLWLIGK